MKHNHIVNLNLTFRNTEATDPLKTYAEEKIVGCVRKFVHQDVEVHSVLRVEKNHQIAEASFNADGVSFHAKEESADLYSAIDALVDSLTQQLRKNKDKVTSKH